MGSTQAQASEHNLQAGDGLDQYLSFLLDDEEYGIDILQIQEIKGWDGVTSMPNTPDYILGVINLRGTVVPVIDLRRLFALEARPYDRTTVVIVVRVTDEEHGERIMGIVVDAVSEVHNIDRANIRPAPDFGGACGTESIKGLATQHEVMLILLDIDHLINTRVLHVDGCGDGN